MEENLTPNFVLDQILLLPTREKKLLMECCWGTLYLRIDTRFTDLKDTIFLDPRSHLWLSNIDPL
jgi:hypothetical protein